MTMIRRHNQILVSWAANRAQPPMIAGPAPLTAHRADQRRALGM